MVASLIQRRIVAALAAIGMFISAGATPALANASAAASADIAAPVRDARAAGVNAGDEQFKQLFASWQSLDSGVPATVQSPATTVSIPSRNPLSAGYTSSGYGNRTHPVLGGTRSHKGIDLAAPTGTPIFATADGVVGKAEWYSSYGMFVSLQHGGELETRYAHMSRIAVAAGERIKKGDVIGYVGSTGRSTGPHLHYEVRVAGEAVNPVPYMADNAAPGGYALAAR